jgi:hypothetical protein
VVNLWWFVWLMWCFSSHIFDVKKYATSQQIILLGS